MLPTGEFMDVRKAEAHVLKTEYSGCSATPVVVRLLSAVFPKFKSPKSRSKHIVELNGKIIVTIELVQLFLQLSHGTRRYVGE